MFAVVWGAVRARTAQSLMVLILTVLPAAAAAAAPWYGLAVSSRAAAAEVDAAPGSSRALWLASAQATDGDPQAALDAFARTVKEALPITGAAPSLSLWSALSMSDGSAKGSGVAGIYRAGVCAHLRLSGSCPAAPGDAIVSREFAQKLKYEAGDKFAVRVTPAGAPLRFRITGLYDLTDPAGPYWSDKLQGANGGLDPFFTALGTFKDPQLVQPTLIDDIEVPAAALRGDDGYDLGRALYVATPKLSAAGISLAQQTGSLLDAIRHARDVIRQGLLTALAQVLLLGWFAIALAGRSTSRDRRGDAALLKLRGSTRGGMLRLAVGQHLVPLAGAALAALPIGFLAGWALAGRLPVGAEILPAVLLAIAAVAVVLLGGLVMLAAVDALVLRLPVAALLRRVPPRRRGRRADVLDLALIAVAVFAVYQSRTSGPQTGLGAWAPALVALALALLLARLLRWFANQAGGVAVRRGRLRFGLTAIQFSRQTGTDRVFALVVVAVSMFTVGVGALAAGRAERATRSEVSLGAGRVLTVRAPTRTALEYAVRTADPGGHEAMAVVVDQASNPPVIAVDSTRLAAVARWRPEYGPVTTLAAATAAAHLPAALPLITGSALSLRVTSSRDVPFPLYAILQNEATGEPVQVAFNGIRPGTQTATGRVTGCAPGPGCRFVRFQLVTPPGPGGRPVAGSVLVQGLDQRDPPAVIAGAAQLADPDRWHGDYTGIALGISTTAQGLSMAAASMGDLAAGDKVYALDAPLPLPIVLAGPRPDDWRFADESSYRFGAGQIPVRVAGTATVLPVVGRTGIMVDLDATRRVAADAELGGVSQVWLAPGAPESIVGALREAGLTVTGDVTTSTRADQLSRQGNAVAARFAVLTVVVALLLAAAMLAVTAAVERGPLTEQLRALRIQGLPRPAAVAAGYAGTVAPAAGGLAGGVVAALVACSVAGVVALPFADGWRVIPPPGALGPAALAVAALIALVVLGAAAWLSVLPLTRRLRGESR